MKPIKVTDVQLAFPATVIANGLLPAREEIPGGFWDGNEWTRLASQWFAGLVPEDLELRPRDGVSSQEAGRHCTVVIRSFEPKHEHKIAGVGYLMSEFFEPVTDKE